MSNGQNQNRGMDIFGKGKEAASNLSEAAKLVLDTIVAYCYPPVREGGQESLMAIANKLADEKPSKDDPRVKEFVSSTENAKETALARAEEAGASRQAKAVITNYFDKLARATENAEQYKTIPVIPEAVQPDSPQALG